MTEDATTGQQVKIVRGKLKGTIGTVVKVYKQYRLLAGGEVTVYDLKTSDNKILTDVASYLCGTKP